MLKPMYDKDSIEDVEKPAAGWALFAARWAVVTVFILLIIKSYAYYKSGSVGLLGSLVDSAGDAGISIMMLMAIRYSAKPADADHRYGHGKVEGLAALFQGAFLGGAAFFLLLESLQRVAEPQAVSHHMLGVGVAIVAVVLSMVVVAVQNHALKKTNSLAVAADQSHYKSDIFLNGGVIFGLLVNYTGGPLWVDPLIGLAIAAYIAVTAYRVGMSAADMLMDKELPDEVRLEITRIVEAHSEVYGMHDLRTRRTGPNIHISFDIEVDPDITLQAAHEITRDLEGLLLAKFPDADIIIHKDPKGDIYDARHRVHGVHH
jgi:ferrous-iron efflux pump FieF